MTNPDLTDLARLREVVDAAMAPHLGVTFGNERCPECAARALFRQTFDPPTVTALLDTIERLRAENATQAAVLSEVRDIAAQNVAENERLRVRWAEHSFCDRSCFWCGSPDDDRHEPGCKSTIAARQRSEQAQP